MAANEFIMIDYTLIRSKRKTIAIYITKGAAVEVRAPLKAAKSEIDRFVASKEDWIQKHLSARKELMRSKAAFALDYGDMVLLQGRGCAITARSGNRMGFDGENFYLPDGLSQEEIKLAVIQVYKMAAKGLLTRKVADYAKLMRVAPAAVKINGAKTRWGSCSGKNSINFSWRLVMAPDDVIDYVVVHELAHIKEHNHSSKFWSVVESVLPDYKEREQGLKALHKKMRAEDWE